MATIILPTTTADIIDGAVTEIKLADDINVSKFINDAGYLTTSSLPTFTTDDISEGTLNLYYTDDRVVNVIDTFDHTQIKINPDNDTLPFWGMYPGFNAGTASFVELSDQLQRLSIRKRTSGDTVLIHDVKGTLYNYDITGMSGGVGGPGNFYTIADQTNGHRWVCAEYIKANGLTTDGNAFDTYYGNYTLVAYEKESGVDEISRNIMTFDKNGAQVHNKLKVVNMPQDSGTIFLSHAALAYTGTENEFAEASIELYNATTDTTWNPILFNEGVTTLTNYTQFNYIIRLPQFDTAELTALDPQADGCVVYCLDGDAGSPCLAVCDGTDWRRISLGAPISTT